MCLLLGGAFVYPSRAQSPLLIYSNSLVNGFQDWGWAPDDLSNTAPVHSAPYSIKVEAQSYEASSFYHPPMDSSPYTSLSFWINGGPSGGQILTVAGETDAVNGPVLGSDKLAALPGGNVWQLITVPLSAIGVANVTNFERFWLQTTGGTTNTYYLDDIQLNARQVTTHITVNPEQVVRAVDRRFFGINTADWDSYFTNPETLAELKELGLQFLRFPGGSESDDYHWASNTTDSNTWTWATSFDAFAKVATNLGAQAVITANYGTGSPQEAAAWVTHSKNANYHLAYWEVGNECYGSWETDSNANPHDPFTYATRAASYIQAMKAADPTIKVGVVVTTGEDNNANGYMSHPATNLTTGQIHYGWMPVVMATLKSLGAQPDFAIYHWYPEYTDSEVDETLLAGTGNWSGDYANLRGMETNYFGPDGTNIELLITENNSNSGQQGKQSTSLVNALYYLDSAAQAMQTGFNSYVWWDLRNGVDLTGNMSDTLYGWRLYGDLGIVNGLGNIVSNRYPAYYAMKLMKFFARPNDTLVSATSDFSSSVPAYASRAADGALRLLILNKDPAATLGAQISLGDYAPAPTAIVYSYGMPQDNANNGGPGSPDIATNYLPASATFSNNFAPYSATVMLFPPIAPTLAVSPASDPTQIVLQLSGNALVPYILQTSSDLAQWNSVATNWTDASGTINITNTIIDSDTAQFWRAAWEP